MGNCSFNKDKAKIKEVEEGKSYQFNNRINIKESFRMSVCYW